MAAKISLSVLSFLLLVTIAVSQGSWQKERQGSWQKGPCDITRLNAQQASYSHESEGGVSEFWDHNSDDFQCAGVSFRRVTLRSRALLLPLYHNSHSFLYVLKGRGIFGLMVSGCPETYESPQQSEEGIQGQRFTDRHQKIGNLREGDVLAIPAGAPHWAYNTGDQELVVVILQDNANNANQLDRNPRSFFLAGNPQRGQEQQHGPQTQHESGNVFRGIGAETLAEVFQTDIETAKKLQSENDGRGAIVIVQKGLQVIQPPLREEHGGRQEHGRGNGLEETICTAKLRENLDQASRADVYNPRAGRFSTVNSFTLPILRFFQLSAARGVLYKNAIMSPHWYGNAHSINYITRGSGRIQVVNHNGHAVFDDNVQEGQVVVVPQNFAVVKQAGEQGLEWVEFNTNDNAMINTLSGRTSALRGLPVDVISNAYQMSREEAQRLKMSRQETLLFSGSSRGGRVAYA
ncbi:hypothetical protein ACS0TY_013044 [Phlomoides rotata]